MTSIRRAKRVLIIKPSSLGDIVHALPVLAALREAFPQAHLAWLINRGFAPLLDNHPLLDEVIPFDRGGYGAMHRDGRRFSDFWRFVRRLRQMRFDLVIDLQGLFRSAFLATACGASRRVGFAGAREMAALCYTHRVRPSRDVVHAVDRNVALARAIGLLIDEPQFPLAVTNDEHAAARRLLTERGLPAESPFVAVIPGARWVTKQWRPDRFAAVMNAIERVGAVRCVLLGAPDERDVAHAVTAACERPPIDLVGATTLRELTALLAEAQTVLCNDSGPMHIAAALGTPVVAIFGPTDPARCGPYSPRACVVRSPLDCLACYQRSCWHHSCMQHLEARPIIEAVERTLATPTSGEGLHTSANSPCGG